MTNGIREPRTNVEVAGGGLGGVGGGRGGVGQGGGEQGEATGRGRGLGARCEY